MSSDRSDGDDAPDEIDLPSARDLRGHAGEIWVRRGLAGLVAAIPVLALFNIFGQRADDVSTQSPTSTLSVHAPDSVRGGLLFEARFTISAREPIHDAVLELSPQWANGLTINTVEPQPSNETSADGWLSFHLGALAVGDRYQLHLQYQVNPTSHGSRHLRVKLLDGNAQLNSITRQLRVWP
jgi:hypothetical protein